MRNIDDIIKSSQTEKPIELRPELWQRLERQLDEDKPPVVRSLRSQLLVAASVIVLMAAVSLIWSEMNRYTVEDLITEEQPYFTKDQLSNARHFHDDVEIPRLMLSEKGRRAIS